MMSAGVATENQDAIIYSSVDTKSKSREVRSVSSYNVIYAAVQDCSGGLLKTESSIGAQVIVSADVSKQSEEELFADSSQLPSKITFPNSQHP